MKCIRASIAILVADLILCIFENFYRHIIQTFFSFLYCGPWVLRHVGALVPLDILYPPGLWTVGPALKMHSCFLQDRDVLLPSSGCPIGCLVSFWYRGLWVLC